MSSGPRDLWWNNREICADHQDLGDFTTLADLEATALPPVPLGYGCVEVPEGGGRGYAIAIQSGDVVGVFVRPTYTQAYEDTANLIELDVVVP